MMINYVFGYYQFWQNSGQTSRIASHKPKLEVRCEKIFRLRYQYALRACSVKKKQGDSMI